MDDYPIKLGAMLFTLVDPNPGHEVAYNRWYERDHYYGGVLVGPGTLAGSRWVSPRPLKDLRFPNDSPVAVPVDRGSYLAVYWIDKAKMVDFFEWSSAEVKVLYADGRGFDERTHAHTALYLFQGAAYRDEDGVPVELALDHRYPGLVSVHLERAEGVGQADFDEWFGAEGRAGLLDADSPVAMATAWRPIIPKGGQGDAPMDLGSPAGTPATTAQLFFCESDPNACFDRFVDYASRVDASGAATVTLVAPFLPTVVGTDTYANELW